MPGTCLYKTKFFYISDNICVSYSCVNHWFCDLDFSGLGNCIFREGFTGSSHCDCAVQKRVSQSHGGIIIRDIDELDFQVAWGIKSKKHDRKKGAIKAYRELRLFGNTRNNCRFK